jgi:hypothetical protein
VKTLSLIEAASLLHMSPSSLRDKAKRGIVPGCKPGKRWVFVLDDLLDFLRSQQTQIKLAAQRAVRVSPCHSIGERKFGGSVLPHRTEREYANRLGLPTDARRKNSTIA